jgi:hypothetical protein
VTLSAADSSVSPAVSGQTTLTQSPFAFIGAATVGQVKVSGTTANVPVGCSGSPAASCIVTLQLSVTETLKGGKVVAVTAAKKKTKKKVVTLANVTITVSGGATKTVQLQLNGVGKKLLASRHKLSVKLSITQGGRTVVTQTLVFKAKTKKKKHAPRLGAEAATVARDLALAW